MRFSTQKLKEIFAVCNVNPWLLYNHTALKYLIATFQKVCERVHSHFII